MNNKVIFDSLDIGQYCIFKNKDYEGFGFIDGNKYPIIELQKNCEMVSFKDPLDGARTDFYGEYFLKHWDFK